MNISGSDPALRFEGREDDYDRYRPGYPQAVIDLLVKRGELAPGRAVADIGSGTGKFTAMLVGHGAKVYAVEPNVPMRRKAELRLNGYSDFVSMPGRAEDTGLPDASVDLVTVAQAFHWFDQSRFREELVRILRPNGRALLIWNERVVGQGGFDDDYALLLRRYDLNEARTRDTVDDIGSIRSLFGGPFETDRFDNQQTMDLICLKGRLRSSSYCPRPDDEKFSPLMDDLASIFLKHKENGLVTMRYSTVVYHGQVQH